MDFDAVLAKLQQAIQNCKECFTYFEKVKFDRLNAIDVENVAALGGNLLREANPSIFRSMQFSKLEIEVTETPGGSSEICKSNYQEETENKFVNEVVPLFLQGLEAARHGLDLLKGELNNWKIEQRLAQIGPRMDAAVCFQKLDAFDQKFEALGEQLKELHEAYEHCKNYIQSMEGQTKTLLANFGSDIVACMRKLVSESVVLARQPPTFLYPSRHKNERTIRPCVPLLRMLGGRSLGFRNDQQTVTCKIVSEDSATKMSNENGTFSAQVTEVGLLLQNETKFQLMPSDCFQAAFKPMQLIRFADHSELKIPRPRRRYYLVFDVELTGTYLKLNPQLFSLPLGIFTNDIQRFDYGGDAFLWWQLAFCQGNGVLSPPAPDKIPWDQAVEALSKKFIQLIDEPTKPYDYNNPPEPPAVLSDIARHHLEERVNRNGYLTWEAFWLEKANCKRYDPRTKSQVGASFREWFYGCAHMVNKFLSVYWNKNLVTGFANRDTAKQLVSSDPQKSQLMIRFSDTNCGYLMITYYYPGLTDAKHLTLEAKLLESMNMEFAEIVRKDHTLQHVHYIYPNIEKDALFGCLLDNGQKKGTSFGYEVTPMEAVISTLPPDLDPADIAFQGNEPFSSESKDEVEEMEFVPYYDPISNLV